MEVHQPPFCPRNTMVLFMQDCSVNLELGRQFEMAKALASARVACSSRWDHPERRELCMQCHM